MRRFLRENGLSLFFLAIFLLALLGQSFAGLAAYNDTQVAEGLREVGYWRFVTSSDFAIDVAENWQSEYLQFFLYIGATVWLVQRGSPESKRVGEEGLETDEQQKAGASAEDDSPPSASAGGVRQALFSHSLLLVMGVVFLLSWAAQSVTGVVAYNEEQLTSLEAPVDWLGYVSSADFWNRTLQNWQSEFLAVGSMAALAVFLRERGSSESKKVGDPHGRTGI
ncbi:hypothetical protein C5C74_15275 [Rathayibacter sp. AY1E8]|jgi:hypothetical protein|uniref:DUF6766 family protein n=1 Tax=unclassified Rathayibacter TaxID=2609250 RepID=UPI000CE76DA1|nr:MULTISPECIES: DUF6766 family protein [unclassified Rathayibacter]PPG13014.1 hypothetical protein C5C74_15275 [Rathayibacter sp. AY1E8]PPH98769.1 hypothetical protein C5C56_10175 [Rathayibacter sp. AY1D1]